MAFVTRKTVVEVGYPHKVKAALTALRNAVLTDDAVAAAEASNTLSSLLERLDDSVDDTGRTLPGELISYLHAMSELDMLTALSAKAQQRLANRYGHVSSLLNDHAYRNRTAASGNARLDQLFTDAKEGLDAHLALRTVTESRQPLHDLSLDELTLLQRIVAEDALDASSTFADTREDAAEQKFTIRGQAVSYALLLAGGVITTTDAWELTNATDSSTLSTLTGLSVVAVGLFTLIRDSRTITSERVTAKTRTGTLEADVASFIEPSSNDPGETRRVRLHTWAAQRQHARQVDSTASRTA